MYGIFETFGLIKYLYQAILNLLNSIAFNINGISVSYLGLMLSFIFLSMVISIFWKGAKG